LIISGRFLIYGETEIRETENGKRQAASGKGQEAIGPNGTVGRQLAK
jgi:hypothetical protein